MSVASFKPNYAFVENDHDYIPNLCRVVFFISLLCMDTIWYDNVGDRSTDANTGSFKSRSKQCWQCAEEKKKRSFIRHHRQSPRLIANKTSVLPRNLCVH